MNLDERDLIEVPVGPAYSGSIPTDRMSLAAMGISDLTRSIISSGVLGINSKPAAANFVCVAGERR